MLDASQVDKLIEELNKYSEGLGVILWVDSYGSTSEGWNLASQTQGNVPCVLISCGFIVQGEETTTIFSHFSPQVSQFADSESQVSGYMCIPNRAILTKTKFSKEQFFEWVRMMKREVQED